MITAPRPRAGRHPQSFGAQRLLIGTLAAIVAVGTLGAAAPAPRTPVLPPPALGAVAPPPGWPAAPTVDAGSFLLLEASTGQVLAQRAPDELRAVASTVKMLTALTVLRRTDPATLVTVGSEVSGIGGASVGLRPGTTWSVADLLEGLIGRSGNDAATALAVHVAGSVEAFVELMRDDAAALGLTGVTIASPSGLDDRNRLSARHLAVVARAVLTDPVFRDIADDAVVELPSGRSASRNELLGVYPGATGIKTGFTAAAGYAVVASALRDGRELIAVVLDAGGPAARFEDAAALLDHGFGAFVPMPVGGSVTVRDPGRSRAVTAGPAVALVPAASADLDVTPLLPVDQVPAFVVARWSGSPLLEVPVAVAGGAASGGPASAGSALLGRVYAGMRAATLAGAWPGTPR